jgi:hypothetical protein
MYGNILPLFYNPTFGARALSESVSSLKFMGESASMNSSSEVWLPFARTNFTQAQVLKNLCDRVHRHGRLDRTGQLLSSGQVVCKSVQQPKKAKRQSVVSA